MKHIGIIISSLVATGVCLSYYYWKQATTLPDWYTNKPAAIEPRKIPVKKEKELNVKEAKERLERKILSNLNADVEQSGEPATTAQLSPSLETPADSSQLPESNPNGKINLDSNEFNELIVSTIAEDSRASELLVATKSFNTKIKDGEVEAGVVVNISEIPTTSLADSEKVVLEKAIQTFPFLKGKEVYVAIEGKPTLENGQLKFDDRTKIKLGNFSLPISEVSKKLGIPREQLEQNANLQLKLGRVQIKDIEFVGDRAVIGGEVN